MTKDSKLGRFLRSLWHNVRGATAIEYGVLVAGLGLAIFTVISQLGTDIGAVLQKIPAIFK